MGDTSPFCPEPSSGLLVMSTLGFKASVDASYFVARMQQILRFTSGVTCAELLSASMAGELFYLHTCIQAVV